MWNSTRCIVQYTRNHTVFKRLRFFSNAVTYFSFSTSFEVAIHNYQKNASTEGVMRVYKGSTIPIDSPEIAQIPLDVVRSEVVSHHPMMIAVESEMDADHYRITPPPTSHRYTRCRSNAPSNSTSSRPCPRCTPDPPPSRAPPAVQPADSCPPSRDQSPPA